MEKMVPGSRGPSRKRKKWENGPQTLLLSKFFYVSAIFFLFSEEGSTVFFQISGERCQTHSVPGQRDCNSGDISCHFPNSSCDNSWIGISIVFGCSFFAYSWKLPAHSGAFLLTVGNFSSLLTVGAFLLTILAFLLTVELLCLQWESASEKYLNGL